MSSSWKLQLSIYLIRHSTKTDVFLFINCAYSPPILSSHLIRCALTIEKHLKERKGDLEKQ